MNPQQYPSWAWSGWVGPVDYLVDIFTESPELARSENHRESWIFSPGKRSLMIEGKQANASNAAQFIPKKGLLSMQTTFFKWSSQGDRRISACLLKPGIIYGDVPRQSIEAPALCILTLFTHVADLERLTRSSGFMTQGYGEWLEHRFYNILHTRGKDPSYTAVLPDGEIKSIEGDYKLVCIGQGRYLHAHGELSASAYVEWVILLIEQKEGYFERIGLGTVVPKDFEWNLQWIDIG